MGNKLNIKNKNNENHDLLIEKQSLKTYKFAM
jgi:hypothetical protein